MLIKYLRLIRLDKPIGIILLLNPTLWALWVAAKGMPSLKILIVFVLCVILSRSAGCIINDIVDRDIDGYVLRTKNRPLVTEIDGLRVSLKAAIMLVLLLCSSAFILALTLHNSALIAHACIALILIIFYPCCKRFFVCPQFILGLAFSYAIPMAFIAITGKTNLITWLLFSASVILALVYDSFYALADIKDDKIVGVFSSAIWFGSYDLYIISILQLLFIINFIVISYLLRFYVFYCLLALVLILFIYQINLAKNRDPIKCIAAFKNNGWVGALIFLGLVLEYY